jgi:hypothetical protein
MSNRVVRLGSVVLDGGSDEADKRFKAIEQYCRENLPGLNLIHDKSANRQNQLVMTLRECTISQANQQKLAIAFPNLSYDITSDGARIIVPLKQTTSPPVSVAIHHSASILKIAFLILSLLLLLDKARR